MRKLRIKDSTSDWSRVIDNLGDIPERYKKYVQLNNGEMPYCVFNPCKKSMFFKSAEFVILLANDKLEILERNGNVIDHSNVMLKDIDYIEKGTVLLHSWIIIAANDKKFEIPFITTNEIYYKPIQWAIHKQIRYFDDKESREKKLSEIDSFKKDLNFKFRNNAAKLLQKSSKIQYISLQPYFPVEKGKSNILAQIISKLLNKYVTTHCEILTEHEIISISEENETYHEIESPGLIVRILPLKNIASVGIENSKTGNVFQMSIVMKNGDVFSFSYITGSKEPERFIEMYKKVSEGSGR